MRSSGSAVGLVALGMVVCGLAAADDAPSQAPGCTEPYRQLAASPALEGVSDADEGYPDRLMYGYCLAQRGRLAVHQDWVLSWFEATPQDGAAGGSGISFGTDLALQWRHRRGPLLTPYYVLGSGIQYAAGTAFPAHGSRWTLTINAGVGLLVPLRGNRHLNIAFRYLHMSNAGLFRNNAGYDAFHLLVGLRWPR